MVFRDLKHLISSLSLALIHYSIWTCTSNASIIDFQNLVQTDPDLSHQFTFDGENEQDRLEDKIGDADLNPRPFGSGTANDIEYAKEGYDETSDSVSTSRGPGNDFAQGAGLHNASVNLSDQLSFEVIFQPNSTEISGGNFNLGYILNTRVNNDRGYFLVQGNAPLPSTGQQLSSTIGDGFAERNQNLILSQVQADHWYFVAGSYSINRDTNTTTFTNYIADLTNGDTVLRKIGPFSNSGGPYPTGGSPLGIGGRWDAGESFPGQIDEINLYNAVKDESIFQQHLDSITGGNEPFEINKITHDVISKTTTIEWNSISGKAYAVDASSDMIEWNELDDGVIGKKDSTSFTDTEVSENEAKKFYRVREIEE
tara:strand:+ start:1444 stop:2550 length:1107 start_codon:yes stop_codon:yes gene_type:complete